MRINKDQQNQITVLNNITQKKRQLATELRSVIDRVKAMDYESKDLSNAVYTKQHDYEEKMKDASGTAQIAKLKKAMTTMKSELQEIQLEEGVMNSMLFSCVAMRRGKHHLYEEMADPIKVSSKTGTKNNTEEVVKDDDDDVDEDFNY